MLLGTMNDRRRRCDGQREHDGPGRIGTCAPPPPQWVENAVARRPRIENVPKSGQ